MKIDWASGAAIGIGAIIGVAGGLALHLKGAELYIFEGIMVVIGLIAAAAISYFQSRQDQAPSPAAPGASTGAAQETGGDSEIDTLVREADRRLAHANAGVTIANLPLVFVIGDRSTAKTSSVVNSGIEAEHLAGHLYQDNAIAPTRSANLWFARGTALVEAGGGIIGDPGNWMRLVRRLQPGKLKSLKGGSQSPRAVLLCVSLESFAQQGATDAIAAASRYLQARLSDISQTLGISFPVYILFTKTDRLPFFTDFVRTFSNEEASQVFGATIAIRSAQQAGVYADDETRRLTGYFDNLFFSLCDKRTVFPPRDNDLEKVCGAYEFPRELRKLRSGVVQFMVNVCRPSQLSASPFLRGFYFSGVRPIAVSEAAPLLTGQPQRAEAERSSGATGMFRVGKQAETVAQQSVAQPAAATRKVPQWMFLGRLFNDVILRDTTAMSASGASTKVSALRRGLLIAASALSLILAIFFLVSYIKNHSLETDALTAANAIPSRELQAGAIAPLDSLQNLESLRAVLQRIDGYENDSTPLLMRFGLYQGSNMYPEVRRLYYQKFRAMLFGQTQAGLLNFMQRTPAMPGQKDDYSYAYNTLKGYLLTTSESKRTSSDKSLQPFLGDLLLARWDANREAEIGKDRIDLAKRQFDYYAHDLPNGDPYKSKADTDAIEHTRLYLSGFSGVELRLPNLLDKAARQGPFR